MYSSYAVDSRTGTTQVLNHCIQPQVGMYSVLAIGDRLDVVVRYEKSLPYTLPVSSDQDCPQVAYVLPRQDMRIGDFFTLFVGREHFMVKVVQILLKSSFNDSYEKNSESSSVVNMSTNAYRSVPVQSCVDMSSSSRPLSPSSSTGHQQTNDVPIPPSPEPTPKPVITTRADRHDEAVFCTRTGIDDGKLNRAGTCANRVTATSSSHPDHVRYVPVELDPIALHDFWDRPSEKIHQTNPSHIPHPDISIAPLLSPTNVQSSRRPESYLPPMHTTILDVSKATQEKVKSQRKRPTTEHNDLLPTATGTPKSCRESQVPLPAGSVLGQAEHIRREYTSSSSVKKTHKTDREPSRSSRPPLAELHNDTGGRGHETWTMQHSCPSNITKRRSVSRRGSYQKSALTTPKIEIQYYWMENSM